MKDERGGEEGRANYDNVREGGKRGGMYSQLHKKKKKQKKTKNQKGERLPHPIGSMDFIRRGGKKNF